MSTFEFFISFERRLELVPFFLIVFYIINRRVSVRGPTLIFFNDRNGSEKENNRRVQIDRKVGRIKTQVFGARLYLDLSSLRKPPTFRLLQHLAGYVLIRDHWHVVIAPLELIGWKKRR